MANYDTNKKIDGELEVNSLNSLERLKLPVYSSTPVLHSQGSLYYNITQNQIYHNTGLAWKTIGSSKYERNITVAQSGADYTSITSALAGAVLLNPTATNRIQILIYPGTYIENNPIVIPKYVHVMSQADVAVEIVQITPTDINAIVFDMKDETGLDGIHINNGLIGINNTSGIVRITNCTFTDLKTAIYTDGSYTSIISMCTVLSTTNIARIGFHATNGAVIWGSDILVWYKVGGISTLECAYKCDSPLAGPTRMFLNNCGATAIGIGFEVGGDLTNQSIINCQGGRTLNCLNSGIIKQNGTLYLFGHDSVAPPVITAKSLQLTHTSALVFGTGNRLRDDLIDQVLGSTINCSFYSDKLTENAFHIRGELYVGSIHSPTESSFGEGGSNTDGMLVYHCIATNSNDDGSTFVDITNNVLLPDGTTNNAFPNLNINACLQICSTKFDFTAGIKILLTSGIVPTSGINGSTRLIICEYWNGTIWEQIAPMSTDANPNYFPHADELFNTGHFNYRFGPKIIMVSKAINGKTGYWSRFRLIGAITTNPVIDHLKLHTNKLVINQDGFMEYFGKAQKRAKIPYNINTARPAGNSPSNKDFYIDDTLSFGRTENTFQNSTEDRTGFMIELPEDIDTSKKMIINIRYIVDALKTGNILLRVRYAYGSNVTDDSGPASDIFVSTLGAPSIAGGFLGENDVLITYPVINDDKVHSIKTELDISKLVARRSTGSLQGDILYINIKRRGLDIQDTFPGYLAVMQVTPIYTKWCDGAYID